MASRRASLATALEASLIAVDEYIVTLRGTRPPTPVPETKARKALNVSFVKPYSLPSFLTNMHADCLTPSRAVHEEFLKRDDDVFVEAFAASASAAVDEETPASGRGPPLSPHATAHPGGH